jgi:hypothetical protein
MEMSAASVLSAREREFHHAGAVVEMTMGAVLRDLCAGRGAGRIDYQVEMACPIADFAWNSGADRICAIGTRLPARLRQRQ